MSQAIIDSRGAVYVLQESSAGTFQTVNQASSVPLRIASQTWEPVGGAELQDDGHTVYGGFNRPQFSDERWNVTTTLYIPVAPDDTDETSFDLYGLLASCPVSIDNNTSAGPITVSPADGSVCGTHIMPASFTAIDQGGNVYTGHSGVSILDSIVSGPTYHTATFTSHVLMRATKSDSVVSTSTASLTVAAAFADYLDVTYATTKAGTLGVTGLNGSATLEVYSYEASYGMVIEETPARVGGSHGFNMSMAACKNTPMLKVTIPEYVEGSGASERAVWSTYFAGTELDDVFLQYGSGNAIFEPFRTGKARLIEPRRTTFNGRRAMELTITGHTENGNDAFAITWGN